MTESEFPYWLDTLQVEWVEAARRLSPRLVLDLLRWSGPQVIEVLAAEDPLAMTASVWWAGAGLVPVWLDHRRELSERWIHRQQLLQALGLPSDLRTDLAGPVLDGLRWAYPHRLGEVSAHPDDTVTITITGEIQREWHLVACDGRWRFAPEATGRVVASMTMTTEQAWRILTNNLPAASRSEILATGDDLILSALRRTRAIIGIPR